MCTRTITSNRTTSPKRTAPRAALPSTCSTTGGRLSSNSSAVLARFLAKFAILVGVLSYAEQALALNVHAVYRTACTREIGIIIDVEKRELTLLGLDGNVRRIPRYEVASIAYYPVSGIEIDPERVHRSRPALE